jgi:EAL domain-containing protein (putative c-di-GMP-specific phosphodiesterase class I)
MDGLVRTSGVTPESVVIEISERCLLDPDTEASPVRTALRSLSDAGFTIAVDDFGTGHSSLGHLVSFPIDVLKIDSSFVGGIGHERGHESIVATLVSLAHAAGMTVVAEGVEHPAQVEALKRLGCNRGQGFYFSRPLSTAETLAEFRAGAPLRVGESRQAAS